MNVIQVHKRGGSIHSFMIMDKTPDKGKIRTLKSPKCGFTITSASFTIFMSIEKIHMNEKL